MTVLRTSAVVFYGGPYSIVLSQVCHCRWKRFAFHNRPFVTGLKPGVNEDGRLIIRESASSTEHFFVPS